MPYEVKSKPYWGLNFIILILIGVLLAVILIPKQIWEEAERYRTQSRRNMQNLWKVETMFFNLTGNYTELGANAIQVVNAVYDSISEDSTFHGEQEIRLPPERFTLNINQENRQNLLMLVDSTLADTSWTAFRDRLKNFSNTLLVEDSIRSGQLAQQLVQAAYDSVTADTTWTGQQQIALPFRYGLQVPQTYQHQYDTTFVRENRIQTVVQDTSYNAVIRVDEETSAADTAAQLDTTWIPIRNLADMQERYPNINIIDTSVTRQNRWITQMQRIRPSQSWLYDPLTGNPYDIRVSDDGLHLRIESPIQGEYEEKRYYFFTLSDTSHGYIEDGETSWESPNQ